MASVDLGIVNGKRQRKSYYGKTRKEAAIKLQTALAAKSTGTLILKSQTMESWLNYWLDVICVERGLKVNTMKSHRSKVRTYLIPHLGHIRVDKLGPEDIRTMYAAMRKDGKSEATISQTHAILRRALEVAVRERKATYNAAALMDRPAQPKNPREGLALADARKVLALAGDDPRPYLALFLGMRQGECLALSWADIDFDTGTLHVERSLAVKPGGGFVFETPKTRLSQAPLPLPTVVSSRLAVRYAQHLAEGGDPYGLVFHNGAGEPIHPRKDWANWRALLSAAGVEHHALHAARNTTATLLRSAGVNAQDQRAIMRHATLTMTEHYQADDIDRKREAVAALEATLGVALHDVAYA